MYILFSYLNLIDFNFLTFYRLIYFTSTELNQQSENSTKDVFFAIVQLTEIFYILNYTINFYLYCLSGTLFRKKFLRSNIIIT